MTDQQSTNLEELQIFDELLHYISKKFKADLLSDDLEQRKQAIERSSLLHGWALSNEFTDRLFPWADSDD